MKFPKIIIDFDSTFITKECLDELAFFAQQKYNKPESTDNSINELTDLSMSGKMPFNEALKRRVDTLYAHRDDVAVMAEMLKEHVSDSFKHNAEFLQAYSDNIYIISGGFLEIIWPIVQEYGLKREQVFANEFTYNEKGWITGYDNSNPLSKHAGKPLLLSTLNIGKDVIAIGDGMNDCRIKIAGFAKRFYAFCENVTREDVVKQADAKFTKLDDLFAIYPSLRTQITPEPDMEVKLGVAVKKGCCKIL